MTRFLLLILVLLLAQIFQGHASGQTRIKGRITDDQTSEPVAFADIIFKGTTTGVKSGFDGTFSISGKTSVDSLIVSFIGYERKTIAIIPGTDSVINVQLHPAVYALQEVKILPGENPAHILLRKFWGSRDRNGINNLSSYQYENYSKTLIYLRKLGNKGNNPGRKGLLADEFEKYSIKGVGISPVLPSYFTESLSDNYISGSPKRVYTHIKATRSEGLAFENTDLLAQLVSRQENFYFPGNTIEIMNKSFISPLSRTGLLYYKYYLLDSLFLDDKYFCYEIQFRPKREEDPVFHGTFWLNDTTFALKRISVTIDDKAELNFINRLVIQQDYEPYGSGAWFPVRTRLMADAVNIFASNFSQKSGMIVNKPIEPGKFTSEIRVSNNDTKTENKYWDSNRKIAFDKTDSLVLKRIDSLKNSSRIRLAAKLVEAAVKGFYNTGWLELGPYILLYNHNKVEGSRFRIGGRTNIQFSQNWVLDGYLAYGFLDNRIKGSIKTEYLLNKELWAKVGFQYKSDVEHVGAPDEFLFPDAFLEYVSSSGNAGMMDRSRIVRTWMESDLSFGLTGRITLTRKSFNPAGEDYYFAWYSDNNRTVKSTGYLSGELSVLLRYQPKAVYVIDGIRRFPVNFNKYPVLSFEYIRGLKGFLDGDFMYNKIRAGITHNFNLGGLGSIGYDVTYSKVFDQLPYPLLITLAGNQSVFRTNRTYNLMNYGEFVQDEVLELNLSYHMNGLIFNKLPLLRKLQWRTVAGGRVAFGSFNGKLNGFYDELNNRNAILPDSINGNPLTRFNSLSYDKPYAEISYGVENIFKFLRIDFIHRLTWLENADVRKFGLKVSGVFRF